MTTTLNTSTPFLLAHWRLLSYESLASPFLIPSYLVSENPRGTATPTPDIPANGACAESKLKGGRGTCAGNIGGRRSLSTVGDRLREPSTSLFARAIAAFATVTFAAPGGFSQAFVADFLEPTKSVSSSSCSSFNSSCTDGDISPVDFIVSPCDISVEGEIEPTLCSIPNNIGFCFLMVSVCVGGGREGGHPNTVEPPQCMLPHSSGVPGLSARDVSTHRSLEISMVVERSPTLLGPTLDRFSGVLPRL